MGTTMTKRGGLLGMLLATACGGTDSSGLKFGATLDQDGGQLAYGGAESAGGAGALGCSRDIDCKGERVCVDGRCVDPTTDDDAGISAGGRPGAGGTAQAGSGGRLVGAGGKVAAGGATSAGGAAQGSGGALPASPRCDFIESCKSNASACSAGLGAKCTVCSVGTYVCGDKQGFYTSDGLDFPCTTTASGLDCTRGAEASAHCCGAGGAAGAGGSPPIGPHGPACSKDADCSVFGLGYCDTGDRHVCKYWPCSGNADCDRVYGKDSAVCDTSNGACMVCPSNQLHCGLGVGCNVYRNSANCWSCGDVCGSSTACGVTSAAPDDWVCLKL